MRLCLTNCVFLIKQLSRFYYCWHNACTIINNVATVIFSSVQKHLIRLKIADEPIPYCLTLLKVYPDD